MTKPDRAVIETASFSICVLPTRGASIGRFAWRRPDGAWCELLHRPSDAEIDDVSASLSRLSSFIMLPFANRIDGARFLYDGVERRLPMNRPEQSCAIHGLARAQPWRVVAHRSDSVVCELVDADGPWPTVYAARQTVTILDDSVVWDLAVENRGAVAAPFGFGLHPWFPRTDASTVAFEAEKTFSADDRTFPVAVEDIDAAVDFSSPKQIAASPGLDRHYAGWSGEARLTQPDQGYAVSLSAPMSETGGYRNLHIFCPRDRSAFCVEPVTHVTDVVNRTQFARYGDMTRLEPGETLSARFVIAPTPIA